MKTQAEYQEIEAKLRAAIEKRIAEGWTMAPTFLYAIAGDIKACCALGAVAIEAGANPKEPGHTPGYALAIQALGLDDNHEKWGLIHGFDSGLSYGEDDAGMVEIGQRLRADYLIGKPQEA